MSAQHYDKVDLNWYLGPGIVVTGVASFLGFLASSSLVANNAELRGSISLLSGFLGVAATTITALRNSVKYDIKAEMFRGAAGQYRLMATRLEQKIRTHKQFIKRMDEDESMEKTEKDKKRNDAKLEFDNFFEKEYKVILTAQGEMKYFPPAAIVKVWKQQDKMLPNNIDQPEVVELKYGEEEILKQEISEEMPGQSYKEE